MCESLIGAAVESGEIRDDVRPYELMRGIGNLPAGRDDPRRLIKLLLRGLKA